MEGNVKLELKNLANYQESISNLRLARDNLKYFEFSEELEKKLAAEEKLIENAYMSFQNMLNNWDDKNEE